MTIDVRLIYRSLSKRLLDQVPGAKGLNPEPVEMAFQTLTEIVDRLESLVS